MRIIHNRYLRNNLNFETKKSFYSNLNKVDEIAIAWNNLQQTSKQIENRNNFKDTNTKHILNNY